MNKKRLIAESAYACLVGIWLVSLFLLFSIIFPITTKHIDLIYYSMAEEVSKYAMALFLVFQLRFHILTISFIGIGFGFTEALSRMYYYESSVSLMPFNFHIVLGLIMTLLFYRGYKSKSLRSIYFALALLVPMYLHVFYNLLVFSK